MYRVIESSVNEELKKKILLFISQTNVLSFKCTKVLWIAMYLCVWQNTKKSFELRFEDISRLNFNRKYKVWISLDFSTLNYPILSLRQNIIREIVLTLRLFAPYSAKFRIPVLNNTNFSSLFQFFYRSQLNHPSDPSNASTSAS